jgi:branched-chain amino acid transport system ATP-binding protein
MTPGRGLEVTGLVAGYGDITVLDGVSFKVPPDSIVALLGANGAGKTTSLNALSGLQATVRGGSITMDGVDIGRLSAHERVEAGVAHVPQGRQLFPFMSVRENLEMGAYAPRSHARQKETMELVLKMFPLLGERLSQLAGSLSGGEQQMCAIARGLMSQPRYLLLDEPSLGLAPIVVRQVLAHALKLANYAYVLEQSQVAIEGPAADLAADDRVRKAYLGM